MKKKNCGINKLIDLILICLFNEENLVEMMTTQLVLCDFCFLIKNITFK